MKRTMYIAIAGMILALVAVGNARSGIWATMPRGSQKN